MKTLVKFLKITIQVISIDKAEIFLISITKKLPMFYISPQGKPQGRKWKNMFFSVRSHFLKLLLKFS